MNDSVNAISYTVFCLKVALEVSNFFCCFSKTVHNVLTTHTQLDLYKLVEVSFK